MIIYLSLILILSLPPEHPSDPFANTIKQLRAPDYDRRLIHWNPVMNCATWQ